MEDVSFSVVYNRNHQIHRSPSMSPENPERLIQIIQFLQNREHIFRGKIKLLEHFDPASEEDILRVHDRGYIEFITNYCNRGGGFLGDSTYFNYNSFKAAASAAGGAIRAADLVVKREADMSFALIRPPGHHASADNYGGYCILNNGAIAARFLQAKRGIRRIMFIDWDAHAANGTMRIFYEDPSVLTLSIHRDPTEFYPHDGFIHQIGKGEGRGYNVNVCMPDSSGDEEYLYVFKELVNPLYEQFDPDYVFGCVGFDAHFRDQYASLRLTAEGYYKIAQEIKRMINRQGTVLMEGGYSRYLGQLALTMINGFIERPPSYKDEIDTLTDSVTRKRKTRQIVEKNVEQLKSLLSDVYKF